jgi:hypothetical protein
MKRKSDITNGSLRKCRQKKTRVVKACLDRAEGEKD